MPDEANTIPMGTDTWNIADAFVKIKIFKPLYETDKFETISLYGTENNEEMLPDEILVQRRIEALFRLKDALKMVMENANFTIRKEDRKEYDAIRNHLDFIEEMLDAVYDVEENQVLHTKITVINESHFRKCLRALQKLKEQLNTPLNNCGLIFRQSDDMDLDEIMKDMVEGG